MDEVELRTVVEAVRARLDAADLSSAHVCFGSFPRGACGATCDVVATVLERRFGIVPYWVSADFGDGDTWFSHAWIEAEGFTIDITADQFGMEPVTVSKQSGWRQSLTIKHRVHYPMAQRHWSEVGGTVWHLVSDLALAPEASARGVFPTLL